MNELKESLSALRAPKDLFKGLSWKNAFAPDNIIMFRRTHRTEFTPLLGVSNNFHHRFELVVVLESGGPLRVGDSSYSLENGECFVVFPNQFHHYMEVEQEDIDWLFVTFDLSNPEAIDSLKDSPRKLTEGCQELLGPMVKAYLGGKGKKPDAVAVSYYLTRFLLELASNSPTIPESRQNIHATDDVRGEILEKINKYVRENIGKALTINDLANDLGYSVSHLRSVFRERLGVSLGRYLRESRLSCAAQMLHDPKLKVTDVAERCGFESLFVFSRAFKNTYGIPPKEYSKMLQQDR